jgi:hypothetical protein
MKFDKVIGLAPAIALALLFMPGCSSSSGNRKDAAAGGSGGGNGGASGGATSSGGTNGTGGTASSGGVTGSGGNSKRDGGAGGAGGTTAAGGATGKGGTTSAGGGSGRDAASDSGGGTGGTAGLDGGGTSTGGQGGCPELPAAPTGTKDAVAGSLIEFNDNGAWCWYQDERAIVDVAKHKLIIGSVAYEASGSRKGNVEVVSYDLASKSKQAPYKLGNLSVDDHNAPAFAILPDGRYVAMWAGHNEDCYSYYSFFDGSAWSAAKKYDWTGKGCPWTVNGNARKATYSNLWLMSTENMVYSGVRSVATSPNLLAMSTQGTGDTFDYYGRLTSTKAVGYVAGYYKYWGNGTDRIDFVATEAHPRDDDTSLYHGYIKGGKTYNSTSSTPIDDKLNDADAKDISNYTQVFKTGSTINGVKLERAWNHDLVRYDDGTIAFLWQARVSGTGSDDPDKRMLYARFDGTAWKLTYLAKGGSHLYSEEQDYIGLGALHPDDPHIIYISTAFDPRDSTAKTQTTKREIYQGITCDNGATFKWTPVTQGSSVDNLRPIVPKWDASHTALLWMRGTYVKAQEYTMKIVGTISGP